MSWGAWDDNSIDASYPGAGSFQEDPGVSVLSRDHQGPHLCLQQKSRTYRAGPGAAAAACIAASTVTAAAAIAASTVTAGASIAAAAIAAAAIAAAAIAAAAIAASTVTAGASIAAAIAAATAAATISAGATAAASLRSRKRPASVTSVLSDSVRPQGLQPAKLLCPWDSPGKKTGVNSHCLLQGIFPTQGSNPDLLHCRQILYRLSQETRVRSKDENTKGEGFPPSPSSLRNISRPV